MADAAASRSWPRGRSLRSFALLGMTMVKEATRHPDNPVQGKLLLGGLRLYGSTTGWLIKLGSSSANLS